MNKWDKRFMNVARLVSSWSSCIRSGRQVGAVIVRDNRLITTGYNGAPMRIKNCVERGECIRDIEHIESGTKLEVCYAIHAEQNAILQAAKLGVSVDGAMMYCTHQPCSLCAKLIINSGIKRVVYGQGYPDKLAMELFKNAGIEVDKYDD